MADESGDFLGIRDPLFTPFPAPMVGEWVTVVHPTDYPVKTRIPYPWFRAGVWDLGLGVYGLQTGTEGFEMTDYPSGKRIRSSPDQRCAQSPNPAVEISFATK